MSDILKQLYYGNISPWDRPLNKNFESGKALKIIVDSVEELLKLLNETEKELFQSFSKAQGDLIEISAAESFADGFCLGMRIAIKVMEEKF